MADYFKIYGYSDDGRRTFLFTWRGSAAAGIKTARSYGVTLDAYEAVWYPNRSAQ